MGGWHCNPCSQPPALLACPSPGFLLAATQLLRFSRLPLCSAALAITRAWADNLCNPYTRRHASPLQPAADPATDVLQLTTNTLLHWLSSTLLLLAAGGRGLSRRELCPAALWALQPTPSTHGAIYTPLPTLPFAGWLASQSLHAAASLFIVLPTPAIRLQLLPQRQGPLGCAGTSRWPDQ